MNLGDICTTISLVSIAYIGFVVYSVLYPKYEEPVRPETWSYSDEQQTPTTPEPPKQPEPEIPGLDMIKNALHTVRVSKHDADEMQRSMEGELFDKLTERSKVVETKGIKIENIQQFLDYMMKAVEGFSQEVREEAEGILFGTSWSQKIFEFRYKKEETKNEPTVIFGMVVFAKSADGKTFDCTYVMYKMSFQLSPKVIITERTHKYLLGLFTWTTHDTEVVKRKFGTKTLKMVKNYLRYKAIETFYNDGLIDRVNKAKSLDDVED